MFSTDHLQIPKNTADDGNQQCYLILEETSNGIKFRIYMVMEVLYFCFGLLAECQVFQFI